MKTRLVFIAGIGVGYLLGARAGRASYERIVSRARTTWSDPRVQERVHQAEEFIKENAPIAAEKAKDAAASAATAVKDRLGDGGSRGAAEAGNRADR
ncbi:hypothetical protein [Curtobacterium ammoniigenes]|uniref:hypothetical protein n=1 Tax=Curtobacterium ammoniigenes TaxID=395387 RepID=UPI000829BDE3|nr:hypothetical protein [Curtobacterium ammoniigenes]